MINTMKYKIGLLSLKYIPIIMTLIMWIHTGFMLLGIHLPYTQTLAGSAIIPSLLILSMSSMFRFCYIHKLLTIYSLSVDICINYNKYIGFGFLLDEVCLIGFLVGTGLIILLLCKLKCYNIRCCKVRPEIIKQINTELAL